MKRAVAPEAFGQTPLIGREREFTLLQPRLMEALDGTGSTIVLVGEGGVGKTRLADALAEDAGRRGFRIAAGRAYPVESGVPYALFADAFMPLVRTLDPAALSTLARGAEAELGVILPGIGSGARPQSDNASELRGRLLWTFAEFVRALSARSPLLLVLDDLHWADVSSLELLHFLARQTSQSRVVILCTWNEAERGQRPELRSFEQSLFSPGIVHVQEIGPLSREDTDELVRRAFGVDNVVTRDFSALLYGWTRGNVFFVRETLQSLVESGRLHRREDGQWLGWELAELELPATIREAIVARLARLDRSARVVAEVAAVIGTRVDHDVLQSAAPLPESDLLTAIDELRRLHILQESSAAGELGYDFVHPLLRQVLYGELGAARARALHATIAHTLEQRYGSRAVEHADELAFHFARTAADALQPKAVQYLHAAGRHALDRSADREAVEYLRLARDRWTETAPVPLADVLSDLARAHQRVGEYDAAIALWRRALDGATPSHAAVLHRRIGQAFYWSGRYTDALAAYRSGLDLVDDADLRANIELRLASGVCLQELGRADDAQTAIEAARSLAETTGNAALLARVHRALLLLHIWIGPPDTARAHGAQAVDLAQRAGDTSTAFFAQWGLAVLEGLTGHTDAMAAHLAVIERIAEQQRSPQLRLWTAELSIELAAAVGEWDRGIALGESSIQLARSLNQRTLLPRLLVWTALIHLGRGDAQRARAYVDEAWQISDAGSASDAPVDVHSVVPAHIGLAACHLAARDFAEAIRVCERGLAIADRTGYAFWAMHRLLPILAEAHCHLWDVDGALLIEQRIRAEAERLGHRVGLAWAEGCRALAVWIGGDPASAIRLIRAACESLESIPMLPDAARLRRQLAGRLAETGDREGALLELRKVHEIFARMGAESELTKARGMFREIGAKPPSLATAAGADGLTGRELEIARMVAARKSNKAIGKALDISPRTVSTHLSNIFRKLDVGSRGELTDYLRDHPVD